MPAISDPAGLVELALFRNLPLEQLSELNELLHRKSFPAGANIMTAGQVGEAVYCIGAGTVKIHVEQADGDDVIIAILGAGDVVGEMSVLDDAGRSASVVTLERSTLLWMDRAVFRACLLKMPVMTYNLARILGARLRLANEQIQSLATQEVENRVARQLLAFAEHYGQTGDNGDILIPIRLTQGDIAEMVGATRKWINQIFVAYKERKYISVDQNHRITIHNPKALARRLQQPAPREPNGIDEAT